MVVTLVSSAFVLKEFPIQETHVSVEEKKILKSKTKPQSMQRLSSGMFVHLKKYLAEM